MVCLALGCTAALGTLARLEVLAGELELSPAHTDVGTVVQGEHVQVGFSVSNPGPSACSIVSVIPSCACAGVYGLPRVLPPGSRFEVRLDVDTRDKIGPLEASVLIVHDGRGSPMRRVGIRGYVRRALVASPRAWILTPERDAPVPPEGYQLEVALQSPAGSDLSSLKFVEPLGLVTCTWLDEHSEHRASRRRCRLAFSDPMPCGAFALRARFVGKAFAQSFQIKARLAGPVATAYHEVGMALERDGAATQELPLRALHGEISGVAVSSGDAEMQIDAHRASTGVWSVRFKKRPGTRTAATRRHVVLRVSHRPDSLAAPTDYRLVVPVRWHALSQYTLAGEGS